MSRPFPMTRVAGAAVFQVLRLYFTLPWWLMGIVGIVAFVFFVKDSAWH